jgi:hypothetical protein
MLANLVEKTNGFSGQAKKTPAARVVSVLVQLKFTCCVLPLQWLQR